VGYQSVTNLQGRAKRVFPELEPAGGRQMVWHSDAEPSPVSEQAGRANFAKPPTLRATTLSVTNFHQHGELYAEFLKARKRVFIDGKGWDLPSTEGMEFDQYDTPLSRWIVVHEFGEVLAGIRLTPTTAKCGIYSYMLRDAQRGLLKDIPATVLHYRAPVSDKIWEAARLFVSDGQPASRRSLLQKTLLLSMARSAVEVGATQVIGIVPAVFQRWMARIGMSALPIGPRMEIDGDRTQAAMMNVRALVEGLTNEG